MSFLKGLGKKLKKVVKIAKVVAPIAAGFFPGGGAAMQLIQGAGKWGGIMKGVGAVQKARKIIAPALTVTQRLREAKQGRRAIPGTPTYYNLACSTCPPNGTTGRLGTTYARRIYAMRRARPARGKQKQLTYYRARQFKRVSPGMGIRRRAGGMRLRAVV